MAISYRSRANLAEVRAGHAACFIDWRNPKEPNRYTTLDDIKQPSQVFLG